MFPHRLTDSRAYAIAQAMLDGFNRHYRLFSETNRAAKRRFEQADWHGQQRAQRERIEFYDLRVKECVRRLEKEFEAGAQPMDVWHQVKLHYIGLLVNHHQPELAETFFNSVTTKILHRSYFHNDFIFVRPAVSTEYIENDEPASLPTYRAYYPTRDNLRETWRRIIDNFQLDLEFEDLDRDDVLLTTALGQAIRFSVDEVRVFAGRNSIGVRGITKTAAIELGPLGIRVNSVIPGPTKTKMTERPGWTDEDYDRAYKGYPLGRMAEAREVAVALIDRVRQPQGQ